jgi:hypothetical protein
MLRHARRNGRSRPSVLRRLSIRKAAATVAPTFGYTALPAQDGQAMALTSVPPLSPGEGVPDRPGPWGDGTSARTLAELTVTLRQGGAARAAGRAERQAQCRPAVMATSPGDQHRGVQTPIPRGHRRGRRRGPTTWRNLVWHRLSISHQPRRRSRRRGNATRATAAAIAHAAEGRGRLRGDRPGQGSLGGHRFLSNHPPARHDVGLDADIHPHRQRSALPPGSPGNQHLRPRRDAARSR